MVLLAWALGINFFVIILFRAVHDLKEQIGQLHRGKFIDDLLKPREQK